MCQVLGLRYMGPNSVTSGGPEVCLTVPVSIRQIVGDGNCFYRAISDIVTGSQSQHLGIRRATVDHMSSLEESSGGIEAHIANHSTVGCGQWVEMYALAHLLRVHLYILLLRAR